MSPSTIFVFSLLLVSVFAQDVLDTESLHKNKFFKLSQAKYEKPDCMRASDNLGCACTVCKDVVYYTKMMILDHVPQEEQVLEKVCDRIFIGDESRRKLCESIVTSELPQIIDYVKNRMDPRKCCEKFC